MKKVVLIVSSIFLIVACNNSDKGNSTVETKDSSVTKDTTSNPGYNPASPPASNGEF